MVNERRYEERYGYYNQKQICFNSVYTYFQDTPTTGTSSPGLLNSGPLLPPPMMGGLPPPIPPPVALPPVPGMPPNMALQPPMGFPPLLAPFSMPPPGFPSFKTVNIIS